MKDKIVYYIVALLLFNTIIHLRYLSLPPVGWCSWRQTQTLAVSRNFYEESMNIFFPRVDGRGVNSGIAGMEFPLVNYFVAIFYKLFGISHAAGRVVALVFGSIAIVFCVLLFKELFNNWQHGIIAGLMLTLSPLFYFYSFVVQPDVPMLALLFASLYFFQKWRIEDGSYYFIFAILFLTIAALIKSVALLVGPYYLYVLIKSSKLTISRFLIGTLSILVVITWYVHARHLSSVHNNSDFLLSPMPIKSLGEFLHISNTIFVKWLPELYINYAQFFFFIIGLVFIIRNRKQMINVVIFIALFSFGMVLYGIAMYGHFFHDYYMVPALPLLLVPVVAGFFQYMNYTRSRPAHRVIFATICVVMLIIGPWRTASRWERPYYKELVSIEGFVDRTIHDKNSLVIACSDDSPSIYLYYMHRKGWSIMDNIDESLFADFISKGACYLISDNRQFENRSEIKPFLEEIATNINFKIFKLRKEPEQIF